MPTELLAKLLDIGEICLNAGLNELEKAHYLQKEGRVYRVTERW